MKMRILLILGTLLAVTGGVRAAETERWGLGWSGAPTLRHRVTPAWELELQAAPDDFRNENTQRTWDEDDPPSLQGYTDQADDDRREQGWVRLGLGRRLVQDGALGLVATASLRYLWSHEQDRSHRVYDLGVEEFWDETKTDWDEWRTALGFRVEVLLHGRVQLETGFGVVYSSRSTTLVRRDLDLSEGNLTESEERRLLTHSSFSSFGWSGTSSLGVLVWF